MEVWFTEHQTPHLGLTLRVRESLLVEKTPYQDLAVLDTVEYGRMLVLDGAVQLTERDEHVYHEMISHVPLVAHPRPRDVLVIGGGDGGTVREVARHPGVERIHLVEIDEKVIAASQRFFPAVSCALTDPRVTITVGDGIAHVKAVRESYDVIVVDSPDPVGPAAGLFEEEFYAAVRNALREEGIVVAQMESPFLHRDLIRRVLTAVRALFPVAALYTAAIPTYPSGFWSFLFASRGPRPLSCDGTRAEALKTRYYSADIHRAAFTLPREVHEALLFP